MVGPVLASRYGLSTLRLAMAPLTSEAFRLWWSGAEDPPSHANPQPRVAAPDGSRADGLDSPVNAAPP